jgi:hypothetical protein
MREPTGQVIDGPLISEVDHLVDLLRAAVENG